MDPKKDQTETESPPAAAPDKPKARHGRPPKKKAEVKTGPVAEAKPEPAPKSEPKAAPAPAPVTLTANTLLQVRPTQPGITAMQEKHDAMLTKLGSAVRGAYPRNVLEFRACAEPGCVTYTLLELLCQFGPDTALGKALPFEEEGILAVEEPEKK